MLAQDVVNVLDRVVPGDGDFRAIEQEHRFIGVDWQVFGSSASGRGRSGGGRWPVKTNEIEIQPLRELRVSVACGMTPGPAHPDGPLATNHGPLPEGPLNRF